MLIDQYQLAREGLELLLAGEAFDAVGATRSLDDARAATERGCVPIWSS